VPASSAKTEFALLRHQQHGLLCVFADEKLRLPSLADENARCLYVNDKILLRALLR
jgi:hypothetical protein